MAWRTPFVSILLTVLAASTVSIPTAARTNRKAFADGWDERTVVLTRTLYSIVYDERSRWLPTVKWQDKVAGLTVATPAGTYYQFDARRESESLAEIGPLGKRTVRLPPRLGSFGRPHVRDGHGVQEAR